MPVALMEWVEVTGKTVEEAKERALDQLGVDESEAEFEVVEPPKAGLFGRLRSEARVRARVAPNTPRPKQERRDRRRSGRGRSSDRPRGGSGSKEPTDAIGSGGGRASKPPAPAGGGGRAQSKRGRSKGDGGATPGHQKSANRESANRESASGSRRKRDGGLDDMGDSVDEAVVDQVEEGGPDTGGPGSDDGGDGPDEVAVAEGFLAGLLDVLEAEYQLVPTTLEDGLVEINVAGDGLGFLIGPRGQTLLALQELTRTVVQRRARRSGGRVLVDVAGYRQARREALGRFTAQVADQVLESGVARVLEPMPAADRKVIHDAANEIDGVSTTSEGEEPRRRVVIVPTGDGGADHGGADDGGADDGGDGSSTEE